ncbi:hypothetical protein PsB1_1456 [Candidatus Phycosocius spiralis]|uniref:Uncharacterized protein n=1 Tax=Candidatus Phycosocius spiralis TaxID=2815099 RepID=A0ABQ4PWC3_9PROT|nr:hypothetical protein PsB1_1456 [Candidatus Phycosocius spiralis]
MTGPSPPNLYEVTLPSKTTTIAATVKKLRKKCLQQSLSVQPQHKAVEGKRTKPIPMAQGTLQLALIGRHGYTARETKDILMHFSKQQKIKSE